LQSLEKLLGAPFFSLMSDEPLQSPLEHMLLSWIRGDVVVIGVKIRTAMLPFGGHARRLTAVVGLGRRSEDTGAYYGKSQSRVPFEEPPNNDFAGWAGWGWGWDKAGSYAYTAMFDNR
jgi:hypothetical protein